MELMCVLHIKLFFLLVHTSYEWHPREQRGGRVEVEGKTWLTKQEGDDRQGNRGPDRQRSR